HPVERAVRALRSARREGVHACPRGSRARRGEGAMRAAGIVLAVLVAAAALALPSWNASRGVAFQGWIEANLIFVGPDEAGRVDPLSAREGDTVAVRDPLFTLDDDLQKAEVNQVMAQVTNARQTLDRAQQLIKTSAGTQKAVDDAEMTLRTADARLNSAQT